jgi:uncharacterized protein YndB with AHSA1/START domain
VRIEKTVEIARPLEEVWRFVSDPLNDPQWCEKVEAVEQDNEGGPGEGARYSVLHRPKPGRGAYPLAVAIEEFQAPRRMKMREIDDDATFVVTYQLEESGAGTRLTQTDEIEWKIPAPLRPLGWLMVNRDMPRQLASLKRVLEAA